MKHEPLSPKDNFISLAKEMKLTGSHLKKAFLKTFPHAVWSNPPDGKRAIAKGAFIDEQASIILLVRTNGQLELV